MTQRASVCAALLFLAAGAAQAAAAVDEAAALQKLWPDLSMTAKVTELSEAQRATVRAACGQDPGPLPFRYFTGPGGEAAVLGRVIGKHLPIDFGIAVDAGGVLRGLEVLAYREAYGGQVRQSRWRRQFIGKDADQDLVLGQDIDGIAGATISARHLSRGVRLLLLTLREARGAPSTR